MAATDKVDPSPPPPAQGNALCCCPPVARVRISNRSVAVEVENSIEEDFHLHTKQQLGANSAADAKDSAESRALANAAVKAPGGPDVNADSTGAGRSSADSDSNSASSLSEEVQKDHVMRKNQAKVYRIDTWTIAWDARGDGDLRVSLEVSGVLAYSADWLEKRGEVELSRAYMLHPPAYDPGAPDFLEATLVVADCENRKASYTNRAPRP
jgi:hypothetical protein